MISNQDLQLALTTLEEGDYSIVVRKQDTQYTSKKRGIAPILELLDQQPEYLQGAVVADKVIGKAAALLLAYGGIKELYALILSEHAIEVLETYQIAYHCKEKVAYIVNRSNTGMCPMEEAVLDVDDSQKAVTILKETLSKLMSKA